MSATNRTCNYCGKPYYVCLACQRRGSWKTICCSRQCWHKLMAEKGVAEASNTPDIVIKEGNTDMKGILNNNKSIEITGYDLEQNSFDCEDGETRTCEEFKRFTVQRDEMQYIIKLFREATS